MARGFRCMGAAWLLLTSVSSARHHVACGVGSLPRELLRRHLSSSLCQAGTYHRHLCYNLRFEHLLHRRIPYHGREVLLGIVRDEMEYRQHLVRRLLP